MPERKGLDDPRSPIAKARDHFMNSAEGRKICRGSAEGEYLENRIEAAFMAGLQAAKTLIEELL